MVMNRRQLLMGGLASAVGMMLGNTSMATNRATAAILSTGEPVRLRFTQKQYTYVRAKLLVHCNRPVSVRWMTEFIKLIDGFYFASRMSPAADALEEFTIHVAGWEERNSQSLWNGIRGILQHLRDEHYGVRYCLSRTLYDIVNFDPVNQRQPQSLGYGSSMKSLKPYLYSQMVETDGFSRPSTSPWVDQDGLTWCADLSPIGTVPRPGRSASSA